MKRKLLGTSLFGFSKTEVCDYITKANEEFNDKIASLTAEHTKEKNELLSQISALTEEINKYKQSNADIAQALFDAQQYATQLKAKSDAEYSDVKEEIKAYKEAEMEKLCLYQQKVAQVKNEVVSLLSEIDYKLAEQTEKNNDLISDYKSEEGIEL